jgi:hypothetical protein
MITKVTLTMQDGSKMTALNTNKEKDFLQSLLNAWAWKGVERIEHDNGNTCSPNETKKLFERIQSNAKPTQKPTSI